MRVIISSSRGKPPASPSEARPSKPCGFAGCERPLSYWGLCDGHAQQQKAGKVLAPLWLKCAPRPMAPGPTMGTLLLPLTRGKSAVIDAEDADVGAHRWGLLGRYAARRIYTGGGRAAPQHDLVMLHRLILERQGVPTPDTVDHINGDPLDNRRCNLRPATYLENVRNRKLSKDNESGFKGVNHRDNGKFRARIRVNGKLLHLGQFDDPAEAHAAYVAAAREHFGEFARAS